MKKKIIAVVLICTLASGCISISGCTTNQASSTTPESSFVSEYSAQYDFYSDSIEKLKDEMELTDEEADKVFGVLLEVGMDEEISYCFDETDDSDNQYFNVWWGLNNVDVYLKDNIVEKVLDSNEYTVYPKSLLLDEYKEKYEFYEESIKVIKKNMELTDEEANNVFGVLVDNCVDDEIKYCFDETDDNDNQFFKVWWGLNSCFVYLKDNTVDKIIYSGVTIYENGEKVKPTEEPTTEKTTTEPPTEKTKKSSVVNENSNNNYQTYDNKEQQNTSEYVLNTNTKKVHRPTCSSVKKISPENYATISSLENAYAQGYEACKKCNP